MSNVLWMVSDEVYELLLSTVPCFTGAFLMTNLTHKGENRPNQIKKSCAAVFEKKTCTCMANFVVKVVRERDNFITAAWLSHRKWLCLLCGYTFLNS